MIAPILLYESEVWGFENCDIIEAYHFKFCKMMLHLKPSTPSYGVWWTGTISNADLYSV